MLFHSLESSTPCVTLGRTSIASCCFSLIVREQRTTEPATTSPLSAGSKAGHHSMNGIQRGALCVLVYLGSYCSFVIRTLIPRSLALPWFAFPLANWIP